MTSELDSVRSESPRAGNGLAELPEAVQIAIAVTRAADGVLLWGNASFARLLGIELASAVGSSLRWFYADGERRGEMLAALEREGSVFEFEIEGQRRDGSVVLVLASISRLAFGDEPDALLSTLHDVTELRRAEAERERRLRDQATALAQVARFPEMNPGPVARLDLAGVVLLANRTARELLGEDLVGRCWRDLVPGLGDQELWQRIVDAGEPVAIEGAIDSHDYVFTHRRDRASELIFVYGTDISRQKAAERELAEKTEALRQVARFPEMNPGPVLRLDLEGEVLLANQAAHEIFGREPVGCRWSELVAAIGEDDWQAIRVASGPVPIEARVGSASYVFTHRRDPQSDLVFVFGADVTGQRRAESALRQSEKMATLGTLAAGVAHELNNPAAATQRAADQLREAFARFETAQLRLNEVALPAEARGMLEELDRASREKATGIERLDALTRADRESAVEEWLDQQGVAEGWRHAPALTALAIGVDELETLVEAVGVQALDAVVGWIASAQPVHALVREIGEGSARISEIVRALRSYSYLGQAPVQLVDVHEGLDSTLVILRNKLKVGVEVKREYGRDVPRICAWGSELNQVWTNLIDNSVDAMGGKGSLLIRTRRSGDFVAVEIVDDGPGVPAEIQGRIFDPFFTTKEPGKGTGLGLSTTYQIVAEKHRGSIELVSRPGATCFTVTLPIEPPPGSPAAGNLHPASSTDRI